MASGLIFKLPFDKYKELDGDNFSRLRELLRSAKHYKHRLDNPRTSQPLTLGAAAHTAVLEPHRFMAEYALWDERSDSGKVRPRRGKDWDAFAAANETKRILRADEYDTAMAIRDAVRSNEDAMRYLRKGHPEVSFTWDDAESGRRCKGRVDWLAKEPGIDVLVGLKTARDCRPIQFGNAAGKMGYHLQWAMYHDGYAAATGSQPKVVEIVVESEPPHDTAVFVIPSEAIEQGREDYRRLLASLDECERSGRWPGTSQGEQILSLPSYVYGAQDDIGDLELEAG